MGKIKDLAAQFEAQAQAQQQPPIRHRNSTSTYNPERFSSFSSRTSTYSKTPPAKPSKPAHLRTRAHTLPVRQNFESIYSPGSVPDNKVDKVIEDYALQDVVTSNEDEELATETIRRRTNVPSSTTQPETVVIPQDPTESLEIKKGRIVQEILDTERSFQQDMQVLKEVYVIPATHILPVQDIKLLFGHLDPIISTSGDLIYLLKDNSLTVFEAFHKMLPKIELDYSNYCKNNEASLAKLKEYSQPNCPTNIKSYLEKGRTEMQGKTNAWDLASLIVKPVQRVLKYPLLLKRLLECFDKEHPDYFTMNEVTVDSEIVADKINQVKKRKDIVDKYVQGKGSLNVIHGISKKFTRGAQLLKQATGLSDEAQPDEHYSYLAVQFDILYADIGKLDKQLLNWTAALKTVLQSEISFCKSLEQVFYLDSIDEQTLYLSDQYQKSLENILSVPYQQTQQKIKGVIVPLIQVLLDLFKEPSVIMKKRQSKLLDHERVQSLKQKGEKIEKPLQESADAFQSINDQLFEELPKFIKLCFEYVNVILLEIVTIQSAYYEAAYSIMYPLFEIVGGQMNIVTEYETQVQANSRVEILSRNTDEIDMIDDISHLNLQAPMQPTSYSDSKQDNDEYLLAEALYDFDAETSDEMTMREGETLQYKEASRDGSDEWVYAFIDDREGWIHILGKGAFGHVYQALDHHTNQLVAIKVESPECKKPVLKLEIAVLRKLNDCPYTCSYLGAGKFEFPKVNGGKYSADGTYTYMVMSLLGPNLSDIRKKRPGNKFSMHTTAVLGKQMIRAIQAVHNCGILHRDVKPGNFCLGITNDNSRAPCLLIDFGLSRRYLTAAGDVRPPRDNAGFRGTARYASIAAHQGRDLGRVDDLWSLFYMTVEFLTGNLPWKGRQKEVIGELKQLYTKIELVESISPSLVHYFMYLKQLKFNDTPDYDYIYSLYQELLVQSGVREDAGYDWESSESTVEVSRIEDLQSRTSVEVDLIVSDKKQSTDNRKVLIKLTQTSIDIPRDGDLTLDAQIEPKPPSTNKGLQYVRTQIKRFLQKG
ncbi:Tau-tubulin kinase 2 [Boothiomyces sp. JEL0866]|nr:Tau-tubulin kinase 2 [Boothiomyces sp. JEL0866]